MTNHRKPNSKRKFIGFFWKMPSSMWNSDLGSSSISPQLPWPSCPQCVGFAWGLAFSGAKCGSGSRPYDTYDQERERKKAFSAQNQQAEFWGFTVVRPAQITCSVLNREAIERICLVCSQGLELDLGVGSSAGSCYLVGKRHGNWEACLLLTLKQENNIPCQQKCHLPVTPFSFSHWISAFLFLGSFGICLLICQQLPHCCSSCCLTSTFLISKFGQRLNPASFLFFNIAPWSVSP